VSFKNFNFDPRITAGITAAGYTTPTPIQTQSIQPVLEGRDVLGLAQTGTGKTAAFVLPILQRLLGGARGKPRALIIAPTRELAEQTHSNIQLLGKQTGLRSLTLYGGVSAIPQLQSLRRGAEILVACPGRLLDLLSQKAVDLSGIEILVLDEADRMFDMGFLPDVRRILAALPKPRQTLFFSATMPSEIRHLAVELLVRPVTVEIDVSVPLESIKHAIYPVDQEHKYDLLVSLLPQAGSGQVLVFTRTKHRAKKLAVMLSRTGLKVTSLQGNLSQNARQAAMDGFRSGRVQVMVATDIAARGIDVSRITHVINYDVPDTAEAYTHRTGRTGRMERLGTALSLVTQDDVLMVRAIERVLGSPLERLAVEGIPAADLKVEAQAKPQAAAPRRNPTPTRRPGSSNRPSARPVNRQ
jgi:ATP-dependent RNA helicase RhlE